MRDMPRAAIYLVKFALILYVYVCMYVCMYVYYT